MLITTSDLSPDYTYPDGAVILKMWTRAVLSRDRGSTLP